jgi:small conductance mechanosensitive channel
VKNSDRPKIRLQYVWKLIAVIGLLFLTGNIAAVEAQSNRATVRLDGRALFQVGAESPDKARDRADQIESRLNRVLETPAAIAPVQIEKHGDNRVLNVAERPLLTLTPDDARDNLTTSDALAVQWKSAIDAALQRAGNRRLSAWGRFGAETQASVETAFARLLESAITIIPRLLAGLLVLLFFWALASLVRWLMRALFRRIVSDLTVENLIKQIAYYTVWATGLAVATSAGLDLQEKLNASGAKYAIIFMTAHDDHQWRQKAKTAGAIAYLRKPFAEQTLLDAIRICLQEAEGHQNQGELSTIPVDERAAEVRAIKVD